MGHRLQEVNWRSQPKASSTPSGDDPLQATTQVPPKVLPGKGMKWAEMTVLSWVQSPWQPGEEEKDQREGRSWWWRLVFHEPSVSPLEKDGTLCRQEHVHLMHLPAQKWPMASVGTLSWFCMNLLQAAGTRQGFCSCVLLLCSFCPPSS